MVSTTPPIRQTTPTYLLAQVHSLAVAGKVRYASTDVYDDLDGLSMDMPDVCTCLQGLTASQFKESLKYPDVSSWMDVYLVKGFMVPDGRFVDLYVKFKLWGNDVMIYICSFHD